MGKDCWEKSGKVRERVVAFLGKCGDLSEKETFEQKAASLREWLGMQWGQDTGWYVSEMKVGPVLLVSWTKMLPAISVNKGCHSHQATTLQPLWQWALRELRIETGCPPSSGQLLQPPLMVHPEETQDEKAQDAGPR